MASIESSLTISSREGYVLLHFALAGHVRAAIREQIAHRDQFDIGVGLEVERQAELADAMADDPDADLAVTEGFPELRAVVVGPGLVEAGDDLSRPSGLEQPMAGGAN